MSDIKFRINSNMRIIFNINYRAICNVTESIFFPLLPWIGSLIVIKIGVSNVLSLLSIDEKEDFFSSDRDTSRVHFYMIVSIDGLSQIYLFSFLY